MMHQCLPDGFNLASSEANVGLVLCIRFVGLMKKLPENQGQSTYVQNLYNPVSCILHALGAFLSSKVHGFCNAREVLRLRDMAWCNLKKRKVTEVINFGKGRKRHPIFKPLL
jgi:hypothetical protein